LTLEEVERRGGEGRLSAALIKPAAALAHLPMLQISDADLQLVANGRELPMVNYEGIVESIGPSAMRICDRAGELVAVGEVDIHRRSIKPRVVLITTD
jgi:tRNA U55 pseudouridine synthase TruB